MTPADAGGHPRYRALDYRFQVHSEDESLRARVEGCFRDLAEPGAPGAAYACYELLAGSAEGTFRLVCDGKPVFTDASASHVLGTLLWHVNATSTQRVAPGHVVLHAAAAVHEGRAVVLPAPMESGKTTTVAGLVLAGFGYLTDEAAAVSLRDLHVEPFTKSLAVDKGSWPVLEALREHDAGGLPAQWQVPVSSLPSGRLAERSPVRYVVLPQYRPGSESVLEPITRGTAVMAMAASTFQFLDAPQRHLDGLARIALAADCYRLTIGSLDRAVALVEELVSA